MVKIMSKTDPEGKKAKKCGIIEDVDISLAARVVHHGGRFYLTIRPFRHPFWNIKPSRMWSHLRIDKV